MMPGDPEKFGVRNVADTCRAWPKDVVALATAKRSR